MSASASAVIFNMANRSSDAQRRTTQWTLSAYTAAVVAKLREFAPYAAMLILPGGSLMAFLWWLYRRQQKASLLPRAVRSERRRFGKPLTKHRVVEGIVATGT
jgi:hypothetical protein